MTIEKFNEIVEGQMATCSGMLITKGKEYAPGAMDERVEDRLLHFKKAAAIMSAPPKVAVLGMLSKHLVSVSDMCTGKQDYPMEKWEEKITDSINYLLILRTVIEEEQNGQN